MRFICLILATLAFVIDLRADDRPNIVLVMVDDLGFADFGCYGSEIETPNLDQLAADGLRFSRFYNTAKCHSSRVSLLTGLYCDQAGSNALNRGVTLAEVLGDAGYETSMVGKWHLNGEPTDRGFERYYGHLSGATNFFTGDDTFRLNGQPWNDFDEDYYTTDAFVDYAKQFVGEMKSEAADSPFFLYIAFNAPHYPLHTREEDYRKYEGRYDVGWDVIREERYQKQIEMGLIDADWTPAPRPELVPAWDEMTADERAWDSRRMAAFAGMVDRVDQKMGELIAYLKENGEFENTLIMICSDNGACPFDRTKRGDLEPWDAGSYWCYDTGWSHVGNVPFRLHKQNQHEGGISSPMIAHWPAGFEAEPGTISHQPAHLIDFMATVLELGEAEYPESWPGVELEPLQGKSLVPIFKGETRAPHEALYFHFGENRALIEGKWKLVTHRASQWELFDIEADRTEMHDLAAEQPERVEAMAEMWLTWAEEVNRLKGKALKPVSGKTPPRLLKDGRPSRD